MFQDRRKLKWRVDGAKEQTRKRDVDLSVQPVDRVVGGLGPHGPLRYGVIKSSGLSEQCFLCFCASFTPARNLRIELG